LIPCDVYDFCWDDQGLTWAGGHGGKEGNPVSHVLLFPKQGPSNGQQQDLPAQLHPIMIRLWAGKRTGSAGIIPS